MDFREYQVVRAGDELVVVGTIRDPVTWDFSIRFCEDDIAGMIRFALTRQTFGLVLRALFKRKKHHHWTQERSEHVAEGKRRREAAKQKAAEHARKAVETVNRGRTREDRALGRTAAGSS
jgi:hypothetical protein